MWIRAWYQIYKFEQKAGFLYQKRMTKPLPFPLIEHV